MPDFWILLLFDLLACHLFFPQQTEYFLCKQLDLQNAFYYSPLSHNIFTKHEGQTSTGHATQCPNSCRDQHVSECTQMHTPGLLYSKNRIILWMLLQWPVTPSSHIIIFKCLSLHCCQHSAPEPRFPLHCFISFCIFTVNMAYITVHLKSALDQLLHYTQIPSGFVLINKALNKEGFF